jgi:hypothetical protein
VHIAAWLKSLGLEQYEPAFRENAIDADVLPKLTSEDLKDLGISAVGHRRKLLEAIAALRTPAAEIDITVPRARGPVASDAERRQVTVLFADLVGYTRLSREIGAEEVHSLLEGDTSCSRAASATARRESSMLGISLTASGFSGAASVLASLISPQWATGGTARRGASKSYALASIGAHTAQSR